MAAESPKWSIDLHFIQSVYSEVDGARTSTDHHPCIY